MIPVESRYLINIYDIWRCLEEHVPLLLGKEKYRPEEWECAFAAIIEQMTGDILTNITGRSLRSTTNPFFDPTLYCFYDTMMQELGMAIRRMFERSDIRLDSSIIRLDYMAMRDGLLVCITRIPTSGV